MGLLKLLHSSEKKLMFDEMTKQIASIFVINLEYEKVQYSFFSSIFRFRLLYFFPLMNVLVYVNIDMGKE